MDGPMSEVSQKDKKTNIYWRMYLDSKKMVQMSQGRDRDAGVENGCVDTEGGRMGLTGRLGLTDVQYRVWNR